MIQSLGVQVDAAVWRAALFQQDTHDEVFAVKYSGATGIIFASSLNHTGVLEGDYLVSKDGLSLHLDFGPEYSNIEHFTDKAVKAGA